MLNIIWTYFMQDFFLEYLVKYTQFLCGTKELDTKLLILQIIKLVYLQTWNPEGFEL